MNLKQGVMQGSHALRGVGKSLLGGLSACLHIPSKDENAYCSRRQ